MSIILHSLALFSCHNKKAFPFVIGLAKKAQERDTLWAPCLVFLPRHLLAFEVPFRSEWEEKLGSEERKFKGSTLCKHVSKEFFLRLHVNRWIKYPELWMLHRLAQLYRFGADYGFNFLIDFLSLSSSARFTHFSGEPNTTA